MRPIPATRLGDAHGLIRAIEQRGRLRTDELVTEFKLEDLFPPDLENALGRMRHFISYARSAGLVREDRGVVELTDIGRRYIRSADPDAFFDVSAQQAEWLRRQLRERHMTDSIFHGLSIGLSLLTSLPPGVQVATLDFGRSMAYLGRAGWDNENTLQIQGERHLTLLRDMELIDEDRRVTPAGHQLRSELTLPIHMSLVDLATQLNPGGADAVRAAAAAEFGGAPEPEPPPAPSVSEAAAAPAAEEDDDNGYHTAIGLGAATAEPSQPPPVVPRPSEPPPTYESPTEISPPPPPPPTVPPPSAGSPPVSVEPPTSAPPPTPPEAIPNQAPPAPEDVAASEVLPAEPQAAASASAAPAEVAPEAGAPPEAAPTPPSEVAPSDEGAAGGLPAVAPDEPAGAAGEAPVSPEVTAVDPVGSVPPPVPAVVRDELGGGGFVDARAVRAAAEEAGLRLPAGVYANVVAALASGRHLLLGGAPGAGKTTLALAVARAAAQGGRAQGATVVTAGPDAAALVAEAGRRGRWIVLDELDRVDPDAILGPLATFLGGLPVTLAGKEVAPAVDWRIVATWGGPPPRASVLRRFAVVELDGPPAEELRAAVRAAAQGDATAAAAVERLLPLAGVAPIGAGVFLAAARHAAARNAAAPADAAALAREAYAAHIAPLLGDAPGDRLRDLLGDTDT